MEIAYDIAIRTVGKGGEKYVALLESIKSLVPQPHNIWLILPDGITPPVERIGTERIHYTEKGMITQRLAALECCTSPYILFCDDDIQFDSDFVIKLHQAVTEGGYDIATGEVLAFLPPPKGLKHIIPAIQTAAVPTVLHRDRFVTILRSSGWSYNRFIPKKGLVLPTQSAAGCMFYASKEKFSEIHFEDELWAQHGSAAPAEDQIMFYKAHLLGIPVCVVTDAHYDHLSAKSSTSSEKAQVEKLYWSGFNRAVFWYRFILNENKAVLQKACCIIAFSYYFSANTIHILLREIVKPSQGKQFNFIKGLVNGLAFCRSQDYKPFIRRSL